MGLTSDAQVQEDDTRSRPLRLLALLAHPDDESLGFGGSLAKYAAEGVDTFVITATRGDAGRFHDPDRPSPGREEVGRVRELELRAAAAELGVKEVEVLGYPDGGLDRVDVHEGVARIARGIRRIRPHVVITFDPFGAYGHPDHIAICQLATAAVAAAAAGPGERDAPHTVSKLYYQFTTQRKWDVYQAAFKRLLSRVDGVERAAVAYPDWSITTSVDASDHWRTVWRAVRKHETQLTVYRGLEDLTEEQHRILWGNQDFYRVFSLVNGGRTRETDLFEGLRP
jgi:LmbE family N-acetylglucosaminyl deacetylase